MNISELIAHRTALLNAAHEKVLQLKREIEMLNSMHSEDDELDTALANKAGAKAYKTEAFTQNVPPTIPDLKPISSSEQNTKIQLTPAGRNPKGAVNSVLLEILADGEEWELAPLLQELNTRLPNKKGPGSLRGRLMNLKIEGLVVSRKAGVFQLAPKGESLSVGTTQAFNLKPGP